MTHEEELEVDLGDALGASEATSPQVLTLYIPNKDCEFDGKFYRITSFDPEGARP